jgi:hypothetical protein
MTDDGLFRLFTRPSKMGELKSGLTLILPVIISIGVAMKSYSEKRVYKLHVLPKPQKP